MKTNHIPNKGFNLKVMFVTRISLLFLFSFSTGFAQLEKNRAQTLNPSGFKESDRLLIGKVSLKVTPLREYTMKAGSTGLFELDVPYQSASFKLGDRLGGIDTARLKLDQELMSLSESMLKEKDIPQWHLQRRSQVEQFENQLAKPLECDDAFLKSYRPNLVGHLDLQRYHFEIGHPVLCVAKFCRS